MIEAFGSRQDAGHIETIDIHGGGLDLVFPHHENEIAQSRCVHGGAPLARYWVHNGFVDMGAEKMSKSLGNIITVGDLLAAGHKGETLRLALLSAHYRQPLPWTDALIGRTQRLLDRIRNGYRTWRRNRGTIVPVKGQISASVLEALSDDLNTPLAIAEMSALAKGARWEEVLGAAEMLGVDSYLLKEPQLAGTFGGHTVDWWITQRRAAKERQDFGEADRIRSYLLDYGVILEDRSDGTTDWRKE